MFVGVFIFIKLKNMVDKGFDIMILFLSNKQRFPPLTSELRLLGSVIKTRSKSGLQGGASASAFFS